MRHPIPSNEETLPRCTGSRIREANRGVLGEYGRGHQAAASRLMGLPQRVLGRRVTRSLYEGGHRLEIAIEEFKRENGIGKKQSKIRTLNGSVQTVGVGWNPQVEFTVQQGRILDRFGEIPPNGGRLRPFDKRNNKPVVVYDPVLSRRYWDAVMFLNPAATNARPSRMIWLKDGLKLNTVDNMKFLDAYQFIYAMTWAYAAQVPFIMGNLNKPAVLHYAMHGAEIGAQMIFNNDQSTNDIPSMQ